MKERRAEILPLQQEIGDHLLYLRDEWIRTSGCREYSRCDGRAQWYVGVASDLEELVNQRLVSDEIKDNVDKYIHLVYPNVINENEDGQIVNLDANIGYTEDLINELLDSFGINKKLDIKDNTINKLLTLRYEWIDKIPNKIVHSTDGWYKIRTGWLFAVGLQMDNGIYHTLFSHEFSNKARNFCDWYENEYRKESDRTKFKGEGGNQIVNTEADIQMVNKLLDEAIKDLGFEVPDTNV